MVEIYQITFLDGTEITVEDPDIDEENRVVRVKSEKSKDEFDSKEDYYPFECIKKILFLYKK